jgi:hypothetical protein
MTVPAPSGGGLGERRGESAAEARTILEHAISSASFLDPDASAARCKGSIGSFGRPHKGFMRGRRVDPYFFLMIWRRFTH